MFIKKCSLHLSNKNKETMKSQIFKSAWNLVKQFGISISKALTIAWKEFKLQVVADRINELELKYMTSEERQEVKLLTVVYRELNIALQAIKPVLKVAFDNSGASLYYDGKTFNND